MTDLRTISSCDLDAAGILHRCQWSVPVNCDVEAAIKASLKAFDPWDHRIAYHALRAVILAATPTLEASQRQIDYLDSLPDIAWWGFPKGAQADTVAAIRRSIAWRQSA